MNTKTHSPARDLVLAALFLALAFVLPMITGHVPQIGKKEYGNKVRPCD
jgi:hypothetical protein